MSARCSVIAALSLLLLSGCGDKNKGGGEPTEPTGQPVKGAEAKTAPVEVVEALDKAMTSCKKLHEEADPERVKTAGTYDSGAATRAYEDDCKASFELAVNKDATLASYKGPLNSKGSYDVPALKKYVDEIPGRIEIAKAAFDEMEAARKEAEKKEWEPLLKGDRLKVFQENGKPTLTDAPDTTASAQATAKTWIYQSAPREQDGKKVIDVKTYVFKKDKLSGKPKTEVQDYIPPEQ